MLSFSSSRNFSFSKAFGGIANAFSSVVSPIVDAVSSPINSILNRSANRRDMRTQQDYATDRMAYQDYLNEQNYLKYQSPKAMMQQYKDAGLNPNLIYGKAGGDIGNVSMATPVGTPGNDLDIGNPASQYNNYLSRKQERELKLREFKRRENMADNQEKTFDYKTEQERLKTEIMQAQLDNLKNGKVDKKDLKDWEDLTLGQVKDKAVGKAWKLGDYLLKRWLASYLPGGYKRNKDIFTKDSHGNLYNRKTGEVFINNRKGR